MKFSDLFKTSLKNNNLSYHKAASKLQVCHKTIYLWIHDKVAPNVNKAAEIAKELDFSLDTLKEDED